MHKAQLTPREEALDNIAFYTRWMNDPRAINAEKRIARAGLAEWQAILNALDAEADLGCRTIIGGGEVLEV
jgi:hypothetical protein